MTDDEDDVNRWTVAKREQEAVLSRRQLILGTVTVASMLTLPASILLAAKASTVGAYLAANVSFLSGTGATLTSLALGIGITTAVVSGLALVACLLMVCVACRYREKPRSSTSSFAATETSNWRHVSTSSF